MVGNSQKNCTEGKLTAAKEWVKDFLETENKLVLFGTHRMTIDFFMNEFKECAVKIDGSTSQKEREQAVYKFQNDKKIKLFVGNIKAVGMGYYFNSRFKRCICGTRLDSCSSRTSGG